jgi:8-oxo-dGTP pyrophosphatase MutT (NUDIX family)
MSSLSEHKDGIKILPRKRLYISLYTSPMTISNPYRENRLNVVPWLAKAHAIANQAPNPKRIDFEIIDQLAGSVLINDAIWFARELPGLSFDGEVLSVNPVCGKDAPAILEQMALLLRDAKRLGKWRDEVLRVTSPDGNILGFVERAAARALGIKTFAVHLMLYCGDHVWVQQRAFNKATDPGMWDTCVGGLVAGDESFELSLERESMEEAGVDLPEMRRQGARLERGKTITVRRNLSSGDVYEGYMHEDLLVWDLNVAASFKPKNNDGEVAQFSLWPIDKLVTELAAGSLTLEAMLMCAESLSRRGIDLRC